MLLVLALPAFHDLWRLDPSERQQSFSHHAHFPVSLLRFLRFTSLVYMQQAKMGGPVYIYRPSGLHHGIQTIQSQTSCLQYIALHVHRRNTSSPAECTFQPWPR